MTESNPDDNPKRSNRPVSILLSLLLLLSLAVLAARVPVFYCQVGGQDEDYYAVPGWTILKEGVPRIPYLPARNTTSVFYKADVELYALPPFYFYWQAAVYALLGPGYGPGRFSSWLAGAALLGLLVGVGRWLFGRWTGPCIGVMLFAWTRVYYFPATCARPDMLTALLGAAALAAAWSGLHPVRLPRLALAGVFTGLALLTHPFALVVVLQLSLLVLGVGGSWKRRLGHLFLCGACAAAAFSLWLPLILHHPDIFWIQFSNNVLKPAGPSLLTRLVHPMEAFLAQFKLLLEHAGPIQLSVTFGGLLFATLFGIRRANRSLVPVLCAAWSGILLLVILQGSHPAKGYWCYPLGFAFLATGEALSRVLSRWCDTAGKIGPLLSGFVLCILIAAMAPGSGLQTLWQHARHAGDPDFDRRQVVARLAEQLPSEAKYLVDVATVLDWYLLGRDTTLALPFDRFFDARGLPYDYLFVGPTGRQQDLGRVFDGKFQFAVGEAASPFAVSIEVFAPSP